MVERIGEDALAGSASREKILSANAERQGMLEDVLGRLQGSWENEDIRQECFKVIASLVPGAIYQKDFAAFDFIVTRLQDWMSAPVIEFLLCVDEENGEKNEKYYAAKEMLGFLGTMTSMQEASEVVHVESDVAADGPLRKLFSAIVLNPSEYALTFRDLEEQTGFDGREISQMIERLGIVGFVGISKQEEEKDGTYRVIRYVSASEAGTAVARRAKILV